LDTQGCRSKFAALLYVSYPFMDRSALARMIAEALGESDLDSLVDSEDLERVVIDGRFNLMTVAERLLLGMAAETAE